MYLTGVFEVDLKTVAREKPWLTRGTEPGELLATPPQKCHPVLTGTGRNGGHAGDIALRCMCQAGTYGKPSSRFYGYDPLAVVGSLEQAQSVWEAHRTARSLPSLDVYA